MMKFKESSVTAQIEILKRKLGGELFEEIKLDDTAFTDGVCKAGNPISADGKIDKETKPIGILLVDVYKDENPNGTILRAFGVVNSTNIQTNTGEAVADAVKTALPNIIFE
jgi:hypothetical protein